MIRPYRRSGFVLLITIWQFMTSTTGMGGLSGWTRRFNKNLIGLRYYLDNIFPV
ncbi:hypothetical protein BT96DRAFT_341008 [Gymnopus androsaceus JB14]|uniref:Uncharacterized protein n=1 Tax=Gymnopus androsaceus JB14 TaxID=1447944 RepID=A0A6A4H084_9AGAR|nr:hypothetical protein BT96DRAFT_341008 [Gymnopus androsaceus JB14]